MEDQQHPGLHIPNVMGPSEEETAALTAQWNTLPIVESELMQEGFSPIPQPTFVFPEISLETLTSPNTQQYTDTYRCAVAWVDYTRDRLARAEMSLLQLENAHSKLERRLRRGLINGTTKRPTVQEISDYVEEDPTYENLKLQIQYLKQKELVYKSDLQRFQDAVKLMSRNVEIRREQWGAGNSQAGQPGYFRAGVMPGKMP